ncbi:hypothetical protein VME0621_04013 [Vibrio mediterranei]|jgi:hypothetical protein|nr:hypothetical protein VME0621_04013 [Vibrio mediterranei]
MSLLQYNDRNELTIKQKKGSCKQEPKCDVDSD